ncbi:BREX-1 system adenine-specific DNA-methyltransferase PglX [Companilactobacillus zhachilii]|uniref:BREX-1 system adenine-specific DNA-methyltransferase PglX n=1 Tax=Companilactobacillus zhachilii TaxID=2304606 RepID=UPI004034CE2E
MKSLIDDVNVDDFDVDKGGQVEIIGWLYQYYNTEPKDIAFKKKKYAESDIPAVTQLFTPDWIVKYMVENSLGRYWIDILHAKGDQRSSEDIATLYNWNYFMPEAKQTEDVNLQIHSNSNELKNINLENITLLDPAMGSGHILIYAFEIFMGLYESEGYSKRDAAKIIVQKNLYGLDIDTRAFQLTYFALMMKARQYNRRFLTQDLKPNIFDIPESTDLEVSDFESMISNDETKNNLQLLIDAFKYGNEYGSLIHFKKHLNFELLAALTKEDITQKQLSLNDVALLNKQKELSDLISAARILDQQFSIGVTNPPYMGSGKMNSILNKYVKKNFPNSKSDLFATFMERLSNLTVPNGYYAMVTQHAWMFLSSFESLRSLLKEDTLINMAHLGTRAFEEIGGEVVQSTTFVYKKQSVSNYVGTYERLVDFNSQQKKQEAYLKAVNDNSVDYLYRTNQANFSKIPGMPIAYWAPENIVSKFEMPSIKDYSLSKAGIVTGRDSSFIFKWYEILFKNISYTETNERKINEMKFVPYSKGGEYIKWFGNDDYVINLKKLYTPSEVTSAVRRGDKKYYFQTAISWSYVTSNKSSFRFYDGFLYGTASPEIIPFKMDYMWTILALLNSNVSEYIIKFLNPTINLPTGYVLDIPMIKGTFQNNIKMLTYSNVNIVKEQFLFDENSWHFLNNKLLLHIADDKRNEVDGKLENAFNVWKDEAQSRFNQLKSNEEELNKIFIDLYGLNEELTPEVEDKDVSVRLADEERDIKSFLSYFIGVVFGRYSLDTEGLAYAGGDWDDSKYKSFVPSKDNILMFNDEKYFDDSRDVINRLKDFLKVTFGEDSVTTNLQYIASVVGKKADNSEASIRRYFVEDFFKDHKKTYQKRPIYWEFSSGKNNGFKALMYLHRYNKNELAMIRTDYLHPLQGQYESRVNQLNSLYESESVAKVKKNIEKDLKHVNKQLDEIRKYDQSIQHLANQQIELDLDDGVVVNYEKLQDGETILSKI